MRIQCLHPGLKSRPVWVARALLVVMAAFGLIAPAAHAGPTTSYFHFTEGGNFDPSSGGGLTGPDTITGITLESGKGSNDDWWQTDTATAVVFTNDTTGLSVTATATNDSGDARYVYGDTWGANAGLGVHDAAVQAGDGDNIGYESPSNDEHLILTFSRLISLTTYHFDLHHDPFTEGEVFELWIDDIRVVSDPRLQDGVGGRIGMKFEFIHIGGQTNASNVELDSRFYVSSMGASEIPEPGTVLLLALGLAGLAAGRRRSPNI